MKSSSKKSHMTKVLKVFSGAQDAEEIEATIPFKWSLELAIFLYVKLPCYVILWTSGRCVFSFEFLRFLVDLIQ